MDIHPKSHRLEEQLGIRTALVNFRMMASPRPVARQEKLPGEDFTISVLMKDE